jgi:hypothetical protein
MTADLVPASNLAELETLDPATREVAVTGMLSEARGWLAHALESTAPREMADFKAFVATIAETTKQLNLSKEIQLDAVEMVRRAERGVGLAIRRGQEEGAIRSEADTHVPGLNNRDRVAIPVKSSPSDFAGDHELNGSGPGRPGIYALTDNVSDEDFDRAIEQAKDEGNLSRANVTRKAKNEPPQPSKSARPEELRGRRHIDPVRVITNTVTGLEGTQTVLRLLEPHHFASLDPADAAAWSSSLTESIRSLNHLNRQLKELNQA